MGQVLDRADRVVRARIDGLPGAELLGPLQPFRADVERDDAGAHRRRELGRRQADRPLAEQRDRVVARNVQPAQRAIGGPGAAGDRRAGGKGQLVVQRHQGEGRHLQIARMPAMGIVAVDEHRLFLAQLRPARAAMLAHRAALVMVHHDALADPRHLLADLGADRRDDAARLVPADDRVRVDRQSADRFAARFGAAILVQIAAAHARGLHLDDDLAGPRRRVGKFHQLDLALAREDYAAHRFLRFSSRLSKPAYALSAGGATTPQSRETTLLSSATICGDPPAKRTVYE